MGVGFKNQGRLPWPSPGASSTVEGKQSQEVALCLQVVGRARHLERNYTAAIAELTKALRLSSVPFPVQIDILDSWAAARKIIGGAENLELVFPETREMMAQLSRGMSVRGRYSNFLARKSLLWIF